MSDDDITPDRAALLWARETAVYAISFQGEVVGRYTVEISPDAEAGTLGLVASYEDANVRTCAEVTLVRDTLYPVSAYKKIEAPQGEFHLSGVYTEGALALKAQTPGGPQQVDVPLAVPVFDNDSVLTVVRTMPLEPGYRGSLEVANIDNGRTYFAWVEYVARQMVGRDEARVDCHQIRLVFDNAESHEMWYAVDPPHALVRYDNRTVIFDLEEFSRQEV
jgi:hypothetical protein